MTVQGANHPNRSKVRATSEAILRLEGRSEEASVGVATWNESVLVSQCRPNALWHWSGYDMVCRFSFSFMSSGMVWRSSKE